MREEDCDVAGRGPGGETDRIGGGQLCAGFDSNQPLSLAFWNVGGYLFHGSVAPGIWIFALRDTVRANNDGTESAAIIFCLDRLPADFAGFAGFGQSEIMRT